MKNDMDHKLIKEDFDSLLESALLLNVKKEQEREAKDGALTGSCPEMPESLSLRVAELIKEDSRKRAEAEDKKIVPLKAISAETEKVRTENREEASGKAETPKAAPEEQEHRQSESHGKILSLFGRRLSARALANAAAVLAVAGIAIYGAGGRLAMRSESTGTVAEVAKTEAASAPIEETAAAAPEAAAADEAGPMAAAYSLPMEEEGIAPRAASAAAPEDDAVTGPAAKMDDSGAVGPTANAAAAPDMEADTASDMDKGGEAAAGAMAPLSKAALEEASPEAASIANPMKSMASEEELQAELGIRIAVPSDASDKSFYIIADTVAEIDYTDTNGRSCTYRASAGEGQDISGIYYELRDEEELDIEGVSVSLGFADISEAETASAALLEWSMEGSSYSLWIEGCESRDEAAAAVSELIGLIN